MSTAIGHRSAPRTVTLGFLGRSVAVAADDPAPVAWLREFLEPWFDAAPADGAAVPGAPEPPTVHLALDPAACARLERDARPAAGAPVPCFLLDDRILAYPRRVTPDGETWIRDTDLDAWYRPGADAVRILAPRDGRGARIALMRVVRELAMHHVAAAGGALLHAAGIVIGGRALLVCGPRRAGKTTLLLRLLAEPDAGYLANDRVAVVAGPGRGADARARGLPTIVALRPGTVTLLPVIEARLRAWRPDHWRTLAEETAAPAIAPGTAPTLPVDLSPAQLCALAAVRPAPVAPVAAIVFPQAGEAVRGVRLERLERDDQRGRLCAGTVGAGLPRRSARGLAIDPAPRRPARLDRLDGIPAYAVHLGPDAFRPGAVDPLLELLA